MKIEGTFQAQGGEEYIYIGNFMPDSLTGVQQVYWRPAGFYLIDNVQLYELPDTNNSFSLYPNPNQGALQFDLTTEHQVSLSVLDMQGKLVHEQTFPAQQHQYYADLRHLAKGVYYYHINYGNELNKGRFVLE